MDGGEGGVIVLFVTHRMNERGGLLSLIRSSHLRATQQLLGYVTGDSSQSKVSGRRAGIRLMCTRVFGARSFLRTELARCAAVGGAQGLVE